MENIKTEKAEVKIPDESILPSDEDSDFNQHIEKCLSMVLHHDEVKQIIAIIKKVHKDFNFYKAEKDKKP